MKTLVNNVKESQTYSLYTKLVELGFEAKLSSVFNFSYDKDNRYLSVTVKNADSRLNELYEATKGFEVVLSKYVKESLPCFEIRRERDFAEFVEEKNWLEYYNSIK